MLDTQFGSHTRFTHVGQSFGLFHMEYPVVVVYHQIPLVILFPVRRVSRQGSHGKFKPFLFHNFVEQSRFFFVDRVVPHIDESDTIGRAESFDGVFEVDPVRHRFHNHVQCGLRHIHVAGRLLECEIPVSDDFRGHLFPVDCVGQPVFREQLSVIKGRQYGVELCYRIFRSVRIVAFYPVILARLYVCEPFGYATVQRERIVSRFGGCELQKPRQ